VSQKSVDKGDLRGTFGPSFRCKVCLKPEAEDIFHPEGKIMFTIPPNFILLVCAGIVGAVIGFLIYGFIKGFEKVFPEIE
jgi:hypothetical protein